MIDSFVGTGAALSTEDLDAVEISTDPLPTSQAEGAGERRRELPLDLSIVGFP